MNKRIFITIVDMDMGVSIHENWEVLTPDTDGKIRAEIGQLLSAHIGKQFKTATGHWLQEGPPERDP